MGNPITDTEEIGDRLKNVSVGDELTVLTEYGKKINQDVTNVREPIGHDREIFVGEPEGPHSVLYVDHDDIRGYDFSVHRLGTSPQDEELVDEGDIEKVWFWN